LGFPEKKKEKHANNFHIPIKSAQREEYDLSATL